MISATVWIFGGRDVGKTTIAMHTAAELRWMGIPTALTYGSAKLWGEPLSIVGMRIFTGFLPMFTPHKAAELCRDSLNFLILRPKYYWDNPSLCSMSQASFESLRAEWMADDELFERTLRAGHVAYKTLPGVRASVAYVVDKIAQRVGVRK
ncbi:hypothetical protein LCGC14_3125010 [marine sediment metagenome]|uniref:NadR/Ttd14 AAA domain-containing protein n=1 Tax=marine sediment metagenome TaxID=412755 RepID=A0A0F8W1E8_9ZZZZ